MSAWYNEPDPVAAEWLRRLIAAGLIAPGEVDERDIRDVAPAELIRFTQCHFFAGIGIWSAALRRAGWPDDRPIWTGSCPCQPFSAAGAGEGFADERHLWPHWHWLIQQCRPGVVTGEQVAGKDGLGWHDLVSDDMGGIGYALGAVIISAAGFGMDWRGSAESQRLERAIRLCPDPMVARHMASFADWARESLGFGGFHIRERQYFVGLADAAHADWRARERGSQEGVGSEGQRGRRSAGSSVDGRVADAMWDRAGSDAGTSKKSEVALERGDRDSSWPGAPVGVDGPPSGLVNRERARSQGLGGDDAYGNKMGRSRAGQGRSTAQANAFSGLADRDGRDATEGRPELRGQQRSGPQHGRDVRSRSSGRDDPADRDVGPSPDNPEGRDIDWLFCRDGFWRPVGSGTFPLVNAAPGRVGQLRAYGNAIDFETATRFCEAIIEIIDERSRPDGPQV